MSKINDLTETGSLATFHAPAERAPRAALMPVVEALQADPLLRPLMEGHPEPAAVLNAHRQILVCNEALVRLVGQTDAAKLVGKRIGEVFDCIHAHDHPGGCGTSEACQACNAVNSMQFVNQTRRSIRAECRISRASGDGDDAWELEILVTPLDFQNHRLKVFAARDVSAEKRRDALERVFFHETLNLAGAIHQSALQCEKETSGEGMTAPGRLSSLTSRLIGHVRSQRDLVFAERGTLQPAWATVRITDLFDSLRTFYAEHRVAGNKSLVFVPPTPPDLSLETDPTLLARVLGNLIENALEASRPGQEVTAVGDLADGDQVCFRVHNDTAMPRHVQLRVFERSFSTKGAKGRGLGTYGIKLLTTRYLGGQVVFTSDVETGTTFFVTVPLRHTNKEFSKPPCDQGSAGRFDGVRVLVADDNRVAARGMTGLLRQCGCNVSTATSGREALDMLARQTFDLVFVDSRIPLMDGPDPGRQLRADADTGLPPIIAMLDNGRGRDRDHRVRTGWSDTMPKPATWWGLQEMLGKWTSRPQETPATPALQPA